MRHIFSYILLSLVAFVAPAQSSANELAIVRDAIRQVHDQYAPDKRQSVFDVQAAHNSDAALTVAGILSDSIAAKALRSALSDTGIEYIDEIAVLPYDTWAQTRLTAASHRTAGRHAAESATQSVMGTPLRVLAKGDWWQVQTPDGYISYVPSSSVVAKTPDEMSAWRKAPRFVVTSLFQLNAYDSPEATGPRNVVTDLVNGSIVTAAGGKAEVVNGRLHIELPDGRTAYADASAFTPIEEWAAQDFNADRILDTAYSMTGIPYLWGGTSTKALDCSGLAKVSYLSNGIILMRDASQQALTGTRIEASDWRSCRPGDLLFFGNAKTGKVTHVAIYDHDGGYVHSSGRVKHNSVDPASDEYLTTPFLHAVRIAGNEETPGITRARNHPWYF